MEDHLSSYAERRSRRESVFRSARVVVDRSGQELNCRVRNISKTGACIDHKGGLEPDMPVQIAAHFDLEDALAGLVVGDDFDVAVFEIGGLVRP